MAARTQPNDWSRLLIILLLLWPLVLVFVLGNTDRSAPPLLWVIAVATVILGWVLLGRARSYAAPRQSDIDVGIDMPPTVSEIMDVRDSVELGGGARLFKGQLNMPADAAFARVSSAVGPDFVPLLQGSGRSTTLVLLPAQAQQALLERRSRPVVNWILFLLTLATTTFAGAAHQGINLIREPERYAAGLPYSLALMAILGCHELGHFFTARRHGMNVTPPYFIPVPFALGTFGAFIQMRTPPRDRRALFDVAVAGPLAGLVVAIPALYFGLQASQVLPAQAAAASGAGTLPGASVLLMAVATWAFDSPIPSGSALQLSPLAFAGWLGLMVTALNLLPIGQLDGGHIARSIFGTRLGAVISALSMLGLFLLAIFVWPGLLMWAIIVFFMTGRPTPPMNDITRLTPGRIVLGLFAFLILAVIVTPAEWLAAGMKCPYL